MKKIYSLVILISLCSCGNNEKFQLCGIGFKFPYYYSNCHYLGGKYQIKKDISKIYPSEPYGKNSTGIVQFKFDINCNGEIGNYKVIQYTREYEQTQLNPRMTSDLFNAIKGLNSWKVGTNDDGEKVNSFVFISIILENGEIIEILPK